MAGRSAVRHVLERSVILKFGEENEMKIAALIARLLLGLIFVVFGLNGFLHFIPMGPPPEGLAGFGVTSDI